MRVSFDGIDFTSSSGPNAFCTRLAKQLALRGHELVDGPPADVQLSAIVVRKRDAPIVLRLDGIYFNSDQDWNALNAPICASYRAAERVVVQSDFDRELIERYFGAREGVSVVRNAADPAEIAAIQPMQSAALDGFDEVWCCASQWRPHKRLAEDVRYFMEAAPARACLVVAGGDPDCVVADPRVFYAGSMARPDLLALCKRSSTFVHLALCDHGPNVVVDARACGCRIVCASSGGTHEIAGSDAVVVQDTEWDWEPFELYKPPRLDFSRTLSIGRAGPTLDRATDGYERAMMEAVAC